MCPVSPLQPLRARSVFVAEPMSHLRQLVHDTLRAQKRPAGMMKGELEVGLFGNAFGPGARAAAYAGCGIDVARGECLLAGIYTHDETRGFEHRLDVPGGNRDPRIMLEGGGRCRSIGTALRERC